MELFHKTEPDGLATLRERKIYRFKEIIWLSGAFSFQARSLYGMSVLLIGVVGINEVSCWPFRNALQLLDQDSISYFAVAGSAAGLIQVCKIF